MALNKRNRTDWRPGERVLAEWHLDHYWYPAIVEACADDGVGISFDDGDRATVSPDKVEAFDIAVGTRVYARWRAGLYYSPARIERQDGENILIRYDNGRLENTTVSVVRILRENPWKHGDRVLANRPQEPFYYPAVVQHTQGEMITLLFDDSDVPQQLPITHVLALNIPVGSLVFARVQRGAQYVPAVVVEKQGERLRLNFNDGHEEWTTVSAVRVLPGMRPEDLTPRK